MFRVVVVTVWFSRLVYWHWSHN